MKKLLIAAIALCLPAGSAFAMGDTGWVTLTNANFQIISDGTPRVYVYVPVSNGGCTVTTAAQLVVDSSNPLANMMFSTLLTAKATGKQVDIATTGCTSLNVPMITSIYLGS
jgi:hypothetical protein